MTEPNFAPPEGPVFTEEEIEAARILFAQPVAFMMGAVSMDGLPGAFAPEVCFAGRSNVGKSSLINGLVGQKYLARASNEPGRTREINFFVLAEKLRLVDLPGYGFARASKTTVSKFQDLGRAYLRGRATLKRVYLLIDARHGLKKVDSEALDALDGRGLLPDHPDQGRQDQAARGREGHRRDAEGHRQAPRRLPARAGHLVGKGPGHARTARRDLAGLPGRVGAARASHNFSVIPALVAGTLRVAARGGVADR